MADRKAGRTLRPDELKDWHSLVGSPPAKSRSQADKTSTAPETDRRAVRQPQPQEIDEWESWIETGALPPADAGQLAKTADPSSAATNGPSVRRKTPAAARFVRQMPDPKVLRRLSGGRMEPDRRTDLHGMTVSEAKEELSRFFAVAARAESRLVLVITGKGLGTQSEFSASGGVLNQMLPQWLTAGPHAERVWHYCHAHPRHGGSGAYYVLLRRPKRRKR